MSRGRGGTGGPRGGRSKPGTARIAGIDVDYDEGIAESLQRPKPQPLFPPYDDLVSPRELSEQEQDAIAWTLSTNKRIRNGPLYTVPPLASSHQNPFESMDTYSKKYHKTPRELPDLKTHWRIDNLKRKRVGEQRFYPKELWGALGLDIAGEETEQTKGNRKAKAISRLDKIIDDADDAEAGPREDNEDNEDMEEELDNTYETDEDDEGGDYNAEGYFNDGDDDGGDEDGGGGGEYDD